MVKGAGFGFADRGMHELKGVEGARQVFEVRRALGPQVGAVIAFIVRARST
jgi:hypothetical protein